MIDEDEYNDILVPRDSKDETVTMAYKPEYPTNTAVYTTQGWCYYVTTPADEVWDIITQVRSVPVRWIRFGVRGADATTVVLNLDHIVSVLDLTPEEDSE